MDIAQRQACSNALIDKSPHQHQTIQGENGISLAQYLAIGNKRSLKQYPNTWTVTLFGEVVLEINNGHLELTGLGEVQSQDNTMRSLSASNKHAPLEVWLDSCGNYEVNTEWNMERLEQAEHVGIIPRPPAENNVWQICAAVSQLMRLALSLLMPTSELSIVCLSVLSFPGCGQTNMSLSSPHPCYQWLSTVDCQTAGLGQSNILLWMV